MIGKYLTSLSLLTLPPNMLGSGLEAPNNLIFYKHTAAEPDIFGGRVKKSDVCQIRLDARLKGTMEKRSMLVL
jgi:hypothetical protein